MKTRRKSKQLARAAEQQVQEQIEHEEQASEPQTPGPSKVEFSVSLPDDIDAEYLASVLPEVSLETPGPETIIALYRIVQSQATTIDATSRSLEDARADLERKDVELDQLFQDKESTSRDVESELENVQKELKQVKQERDELASLNASLQSQVTSLTSSQSSSSTEVDVLKRRVEETEREKRDLVGVVSRLKEDSVQRDEEIQTLRASLKQARQEYQALETQLRELRSTENSTKFKLDSLSQQLQLAKDEAARATSELTVKAEEYTQYRHTKHAELAALQSTHDALVQTHASTGAKLASIDSVVRLMEVEAGLVRSECG
ncbi:hypothetical protein EWM64_g1811 [Hericium alpestre]|uniref:Uncharacterized protein n=1 Tax=Hericium alpestre TaxID=135208 RepID=A0A4Z0A7F4_9AGAM|nr:hypothetical protein EWM64_g1811 [Hericium alpestre]